jgi:3-(3-hydroxy-phenyl)propionate hydroxylase
MRRRNIVVVGAGPVGSVAALAAARFGHTVTLVEAQHKVDENPRASTTQPPTLEILAELGLIDEYIRVGLVARTFQFWDRGTLTKVAEFDFERLRGKTGFPFVVQTEQHKLVKIGLRRLADFPDAHVHRPATVVSVAQTDDDASVVVETGEGEQTFTGDYVIACDGGRSAVRKSLGIDFPGYTWPERFLVLTTEAPFDELIGCSLRSYFADPDEWTNLFKVAGEDGAGRRWRAVFPARVGETDDEALDDASADERLARLVPEIGHADVAHRNLYKVHQRVAAEFRRGRVFLAGDSAHVNNPIGGLGLNCGIHDAVELIDTLEAVTMNGADSSLLDRYERRRRPLIVEFVQQQTIANKKRLEEQDEAAREARRNELVEHSSTDERQRDFLLRSSLLLSVRRSRTIE